MYDLTPEVEPRLDGQGQPGNVFRVYFRGRIFDIMHSPLGPWVVWRLFG